MAYPELFNIPNPVVMPAPIPNSTLNPSELNVKVPNLDAPLVSLKKYPAEPAFCTVIRPFVPTFINELPPTCKSINKLLVLEVVSVTFALIKVGAPVVFQVPFISNAG